MMMERFSVLCLISYPNEIQEVHSSRLGDNKLVELLAVYRPHELTHLSVFYRVSSTVPPPSHRLFFCRSHE